MRYEKMDQREDKKGVIAFVELYAVICRTIALERDTKQKERERDKDALIVV